MDLVFVLCSLCFFFAFSAVNAYRLPVRKRIGMTPENTSLNSKVSAILLAGGQSRRMGGNNKALLTVSGQTIIERVAHVLGRVFTEVLVITNTHEAFQFLGLPMVADLRPGTGSLGGLYTGLTACTSDRGFLVACDMPFVHEGVVRNLAERDGRYQVVIPRVGAHLEPLHAVYSRSCLPHIKDLLDGGDLKIINLFSKVSLMEVPETHVRLIDPSLRCFMNINTPADLNLARSLIEHAD